MGRGKLSMNWNKARGYFEPGFVGKQRTLNSMYETADSLAINQLFVQCICTEGPVNRAFANGAFDEPPGNRCGTTAAILDVGWERRRNTTDGL